MSEEEEQNNKKYAQAHRAQCVKREGKKRYIFIFIIHQNNYVYQARMNRALSFFHGVDMHAQATASTETANKHTHIHHDHNLYWTLLVSAVYETATKNVWSNKSCGRYD